MAAGSTTTSDVRTAWRTRLTDVLLALAVLAATMVGRSARTTRSHLALPDTWTQCLDLRGRGGRPRARAGSRWSRSAVTVVLDALPYWLDDRRRRHHLA